MDRTRNLAGIALLGALLVFTTACGQKPWVAEQYEEITAAGGFVDPETGQVLDAEGNPVDGSGALGGSGGGSTTLGGSSGSSGTAGTEGTEGTEGTTSSDDGDNSNDKKFAPPVDIAGAPKGGNSTGVSKSAIKIGFHAPLSGAAPVPSASVSKGKDLYFRYYGKVVNGRTVQVVLKDDRYNPSTAVAVCKEMVQNDKVFLLSGAAGTDQIAACAKYANSVGVPYLSAGVTEAGLTGLRTYFATTMTYPDQAPVLADYMASNLGARGEQNAMVWFNTSSFQDAHSAFISAARSQGVPITADHAVSKGASEQDALRVASDLRAKGVDNVFVLTSPFWFLKLLSAARSQGYSPQWTGIGITKTFDQVANPGCKGGTIDGAKFFSPFPAWIDSKKYDPNFDRAVRKLHPESNGGDDFMWLSWAFSKVGADLMKLPGSNLTRERFIFFAERSRGIRSGIFPTLSFSPSDHFGSTEVHVLEARCSDSRWHTIASFVNRF